MSREPGARRRKVRPGTSRADLLELLEEPTPISEVMKRFGWTRKEARENILTLHRHVGYGIRDVDGKITIIG